MDDTEKKYWAAVNRLLFSDAGEAMATPKKEPLSFKKKSKPDEQPPAPARFDAIHTTYSKGEPPDEQRGGADIEITSHENSDFFRKLGDLTASGTSESPKVAMEVLFDRFKTGGYRQRVKLFLNARDARDIAYTLLLFANDLE